MEENMNRDEVIEQLETTAAEERPSYEDLPACPYEEDGLDLKSMVIGGAVIGAVTLIATKGPKAINWVKNKIRKGKEDRKERDEALSREFDDDADFKEVPDEEEPEEKNEE